MESRGLRLVTGAPTTTCCLVDSRLPVTSPAATPRPRSTPGITVNKNTIPGEQRSPLCHKRHSRDLRRPPRVGLTRRSASASVSFIGDVVTNLGDENVQERVAGEVKEFLQAHPLSGV